jgi:hypothetical protein
LASIMALQAGLPILDYSLISEKRNKTTLRQYKTDSTEITISWITYLRRLSRTRLGLFRVSLERTARYIRYLLAYRFYTGAGLDSS